MVQLVPSVGTILSESCLIKPPIKRKSYFFESPVSDQRPTQNAYRQSGWLSGPSVEAGRRAVITRKGLRANRTAVRIDCLPCRSRPDVCRAESSTSSLDSAQSSVVCCAPLVGNHRSSSSSVRTSVEAAHRKTERGCRYREKPAIDLPTPFSLRLANYSCSPSLLCALSAMFSTPQKRNNTIPMKMVFFILSALLVLFGCSSASACLPHSSINTSHQVITRDDLKTPLQSRRYEGLFGTN